jgi:hypothetical protein
MHGFTDFQENVHSGGIRDHSDILSGCGGRGDLEELCLVAINEVPLGEVLHPVPPIIARMNVRGDEEPPRSEHVIEDLQQPPADAI